MNVKASSEARRAVENHKFTAKDIKKLKKKVLSLRKSRLPAAQKIANSIEKILAERT